MNSIVPLIGVIVLGLNGNALAKNAAANPSAEIINADGAPIAWGLYSASGNPRLISVTDQKHSGQRSACLELAGGNPTAMATKQTASGGIVFAANNGYTAQGAMPCRSGDLYSFAFWYRGDVSKATVAAVGWPLADATHTDRISIPVSAEAISPDAEWRRCVGRFRIPENVRRFVLGVNVAGDEKTAMATKRLFLDDVEIVPRTTSDGELRGLAWVLPRGERKKTMIGIESELDKIKNAGLNTVFVFVSSRYLAALDRPELQKDEPEASWDILAKLIQTAKQRAIQVHLWYSPWIYKSPKSHGAIELQTHPEWAAVNIQGIADSDGICLIRPEVRKYELDLLEKAMDRYPDLAGIHIEEPGFNWGDYCYCDNCRRFCQQSLGIDIRKPHQAAKPILQNLAAAFCSDFIVRLRALMNAKRPEMQLSANGCGGCNPDWRLGRDWVSWAHRGYIDFYAPQLYFENVDGIVKDGSATKACLGQCDMIPIIAISWSGMHPRKQSPETFKAQIAAVRRLSGKGFFIYFQGFCDDRYYRLIREAVQP